MLWYLKIFCNFASLITAPAFLKGGVLFCDFSLWGE